MHSLPDLTTGIRKIKGKIAILNITSYCNADCIFCSEGIHDDPVNVPLATIKKTVCKLKALGVREVNFMGGETTLRTDLEEILAFIKKQGMAVYIVTNGLKFSDPVFAKKILKFLDSMEISVPAHEKNMFKELTGVDGFEQLLQGIENIKRFNRCVALFFNFVPNSINAAKIKDVFSLIKKIFQGKKFIIHVKTLNVEGKVKKHLQLLPDYGKFRPHLKNALQYALDNDFGVVVSRFPLCSYDGYEFLCLELPLELRENGVFFYNDRILDEKTDFPLNPSSSILMNNNFSDLCFLCSLKPICPGLDPEYFKAKNDMSFLMPQKKRISSILRKMFEKSYFFKLDYSYHSYNLSPKKWTQRKLIVASSRPSDKWT